MPARQTVAELLECAEIAIRANAGKIVEDLVFL
jgi:hypothetical protein